VAVFIDKVSVEVTVWGRQRIQADEDSSAHVARGIKTCIIRSCS